MKKVIACIFGVFFSLIVLPVYAFDGITYYSTTISASDRYNSSGERLTSVGAILRQDRANMYKYGNSDPGDQSDSFFSNAANRSMFESARIKINSGLARQIINGGATDITVYVYPGYIEVR